MTTDEISQAVAPIASLRSKSEKALRNLKPTTLQYARLQAYVDSLKIALSLMQAERRPAGRLTPEQLRTSLNVMTDLKERSEKAAAKTARGTSQHALLQNRIHALSVALSLVKAELKSLACEG